MGHSPKEKPK